MTADDDGQAKRIHSRSGEEDAAMVIERRGAGSPAPPSFMDAAEPLTRARLTSSIPRQEGALRWHGWHAVHRARID